MRPRSLEIVMLSCNIEWKWKALYVEQSADELTVNGGVGAVSVEVEVTEEAGGRELRRTLRRPRAGELEAEQPRADLGQLR